MSIVVENLRLKELIIIVNRNRLFYEEFAEFIRCFGYNEIYDLISESDENKVIEFANKYFEHNFSSDLYDGIGRPYKKATAKWYFITWILRDAPQQRLQPIVASLKGKSIQDRRVWVINEIRKFVGPLLPHRENWKWPVISEIMLHRLEGSRRALKGGLFENIVRFQLRDLFEEYKINLKVTEKEVRIKEETYDVEVIGTKAKILMPVKTRETMGGGHSLLFTRDIHKSISVAKDNGIQCIPVVIAESWIGNLDDLPCDNYIYLSINPNQVEKINSLLYSELVRLVGIFRQIE